METRAKLLRKKKGHESHHIVPKSIAGSNDKANLVLLTFREHFLAHWLLTKMTEGAAKRKMNYGLRKMMNSPEHSPRILTSWQYARSRVAGIEALRGPRGKTGKPSWNSGKTMDLAYRERSRAGAVKRFQKPEERQKTSAHRRRSWQNPSLAMLEGIRKARGDKKTCPHCEKAFDAGPFSRWHGENCKLSY